MHRRLAKMLSFANSLAVSPGKQGLALCTDTTNRVFPVPTDKDGTWIAQARTVPSFVCDAVFGVEPSFYVGPENGMNSVEWETANVRLPPVDLACRFADRVTTEELLGHEDALIVHYRRIIEIAGKYGKTKSLRPFPYFRIQPAVIADSHLLTSFSWTDDLHETQTVLDVFVEAGAGPARLVHADQDQGWGLLVVTSGVATCLIEWDAEGLPPAEGGFAFDHAELARQASAALERLKIIHSRLVKAVGRDYWT